MVQPLECLLWAQHSESLSERLLAQLEKQSAQLSDSPRDSPSVQSWEPWGAEREQTWAHVSVMPLATVCSTADIVPGRQCRTLRNNRH